MSPLRKIVSLPKSRSGRAFTVLALVWFMFVVVLFVKEQVSPRPTRQICKDFAAAREWIDGYRLKHGHLPSKGTYHRFLTGSGLTIPLEYEALEAGESYVLLGWDGERRWAFHADSGCTVVLNE